jgi:peroxiredoxin Q/BCP
MRFLSAALVSAALGGLPVSVVPDMADLKVGDPAPPFSLPGSDGRTYRLSDYAGKQVVVLAWFARAFTSG